MGPRAEQYTLLGDTGTQTTAIASDLVVGTTYYFAVTAYNSQGLESAYSNEVAYAAPARLHLHNLTDKQDLHVSSRDGFDYRDNSDWM